MYHYNHECFDAYYSDLALELESGRAHAAGDSRPETMIATRALGIIAALSITVASFMILINAGF